MKLSIRKHDVVIRKRDVVAGLFGGALFLAGAHFLGGETGKAEPVCAAPSGEAAKSVGSLAVNSCEPTVDQADDDKWPPLNTVPAEIVASVMGVGLGVTILRQFSPVPITPKRHDQVLESTAAVSADKEQATL